MPYKFFLKASFIALVLFAHCEMSSAVNLRGRWSDNAPDNSRLGNLVITDHTFTIEGLVTYTISNMESFGAGELLKVTNATPLPDPMGCGAENKINYLIVLPIPENPAIKQEAIRIIFYGGVHLPNPTEIEADTYICAVQPYGRSTKERSH